MSIHVEEELDVLKDTIQTLAEMSQHAEIHLNSPDVNALVGSDGVYRYFPSHLWTIEMTVYGVEGGSVDAECTGTSIHDVVRKAYAIWNKLR